MNQPELSARLATLEEISCLRDLYRQEMNCQIIHDSIHPRPGWTLEYFLHFGDLTVGYDSVAVSGPWKGKPTIYEFYVLPFYRSRLFDLFSVLLSISKAVAIETQSNDSLLTVMLYTFARDVLSESILFHDKLTTSLAPKGAVFRRATADDGLDITPEQLLSHGIVELEGAVAGKGGILFHYNRPYGDIYMEVAEPFRKRGIGSFLVQELKRVCYERGNIPSARCNVNNIASRKTLQKAGFVPCGYILAGLLLK
ncbi:MAG TPA: GNAT family N-acetyltransferase [Verrucomicrobiae bacterium]|jgi:GNAT superfamily N-acetyltransferase|nr:GNAT family N-acetyltransferase [Verrucomicrobiae bacterium]